MNSNKTMVKIQDLQPACQYKSTFTVGLFSDGKEISRGKLSEDIILNTMLSSPPVELDCKNKTVSAASGIYGFTCTWKKPNKPSWIHNQTQATRLGHGDIRYRL